MKKCFEEKDKVRQLCAIWGVHDESTAFQIAIQRNDAALVKYMLCPDVKKKGQETLEQAISNVYNMRKDPEPYLINFVDSGQVNDMAYGA